MGDRFVQIAACRGDLDVHLYALDEDGNVWKYEPCSRGDWLRLGTTGYSLFADASPVARSLEGEKT